MSEPTQPIREAELAALPVHDLRSAIPYLTAPFTPQTLGMFARRTTPGAGTARVVFFIPILEVEARLNLVAGPEHWCLGRPSAIDATSLACAMTLFDVTHIEVGQGEDRRAQQANGCKRCALHFGVGRYLKQIEPLEFPIGTGPSDIPTDQHGDPYLPDAMIATVRVTYAHEIARLAATYGPPLTHPTQPWTLAHPPRWATRPRLRSVGRIADALLASATRDGRGASDGEVLLKRFLAGRRAAVRTRVQERRNGQVAPSSPGPMPADGRMAVVPEPDPLADAAQDAQANTIAVDFTQIGPRRYRKAA